MLSFFEQMDNAMASVESSEGGAENEAFILKSV